MGEHEAAADGIRRPILWIVMVLVAVGLVLAAAIIITLTVKELKAQHKRNKKGGHRNE